MFFCAQCCHEVLPFVIKLVVAGLSISYQFRRRLILETNVHFFFSEGEYFSTFLTDVPNIYIQMCMYTKLPIKLATKLTG